MNTNENNISQAGTLTQSGNVAQQTTQDINTTQHLNRNIDPTDPRPRVVTNENIGTTQRQFPGLNNPDELEIDTDEIYDGEPEEPQNESIDYGFREFSVKKLNYGYVIKAGCHQFAIESESRLIKVISEYIKDPSGKEKQWWETKNI